MEPMLDQSGKIFNIPLTSERPAKELMDIAKNCAETRDIEGLYDIDVALTSLLIDYIRKGTEELFEAFMDDMMAFLDSRNGDRLKSFSEGERYYYRWEHLVDLSDVAIENYDSDMTARFIESRKHGHRLLEVLYNNTEGIRSKDLANTLGLSEQHLAKLLREFEEHDLIKREKRKKMTIVHIGFLGRVYMSDVKEARSSAVREETGILKIYESQWNNPFPDQYHDPNYLKLGVQFTKRIVNE